MSNRRTIYFHAGGAKTGSSALQNFFELNKEIFAEKGISYLNGPEVRSEFDIISGNGILLVNSVRFQVSDAGLENIILGYFADGIDNALCSSEALELFDEKSWRRVLDCCHGLGIECRIIFFVRDVIPYIYSSYNQFVKRHGESRPIELFVKDARWGHVDVLRTLTKVAQPESLHILHYDALHNGLIDEFLKVIGIADSGEFDKAKDVRVNRSLDAAELHLLKEINGVLGAKYSAEMSDWLIAHRPKSNVKVIYEKKIVQQLEESFSADIAWVNNTFFGGVDQVQAISQAARAKISIEQGPAETDPNSSANVLLQWAVKKIATMYDTFYVSMVSRMWDLVMEKGYDNHPDIPADFNPVTYLFLNPDLLEANALPFSHYINHGKSEGRKYLLQQPALDEEEEMLYTGQQDSKAGAGQDSSAGSNKVEAAFAAVRRRGGLVIGQNAREKVAMTEDAAGDAHVVRFLVSSTKEMAPAGLQDLLPPDAVIDWKDKETFLTDLKSTSVSEMPATRWIWLYDEPWAEVAGLPRDAIAPALHAWFKLQQEILKIRRGVGKQLMLVNASRMQPQHQHAGLFEQMFAWLAPHFWDALEALEAVAWLPAGQEPRFRKRGLGAADEQSLFHLLGSVSDASQLTPLQAELQRTREALSAVTSQLKEEQGGYAQLQQQFMQEQLLRLQQEEAAAAKAAALEHQQMRLHHMAAEAQATEEKLREALQEQQQYAEALQVCGSELASAHQQADALATQLEQEQYAHFVLQRQLDEAHVSLQATLEELDNSKQTMQTLAAKENEEMANLARERDHHLMRLHELQEKLEQQMLANHQLETMIATSTGLLHRARSVVSTLVAKRKIQAVAE